MDSFFDKLKSSTKSLHLALEQTPLSKAIMAPDVKPEAYIEYLRRSFLMHDEMEAAIFPLVTGVIKDIEKRKKTTAILSDLKQLQVAPVEASGLKSQDGYVNNLNFQLGMLYVTEGSTLGGLYILKNIRQALGAEVPGNFLQVYGEKTGTMWKEFLVQFDSYQQNCTEAEKEEIISGALYEFGRAKNIFEQKA